MIHKHNFKSRWLLGLLCAAALMCGCQADKDWQRELLINENRLLEDTIYDREDEIQEMNRQLDASHRANNYLKQELAVAQRNQPAVTKGNGILDKVFGNSDKPQQVAPEVPMVDVQPSPSKSDSKSHSTPGSNDTPPMLPDPMPTSAPPKDE